MSDPEPIDYHAEEWADFNSIAKALVTAAIDLNADFELDDKPAEAIAQTEAQVAATVPNVARKSCPKLTQIPLAKLFLYPLPPNHLWGSGP